MKEKLIKNIKNSEDEFADVIKKLKSLPDTPLPSDFETKLLNRIAISNQEKHRLNFSNGNYSRFLIFGGSFVIVVFLVVLSIFIYNGNHNINKFKGNIDSTEYKGNNVIIIPPVETQIEGVGKKPAEKIIKPNNEYKSTEKIEEYFKEKTENASKQLNTIAPLNKILSSPAIKKGLNIDTLKKDSTKDQKNK
jgi:hypothetical protein